MKKLSLLLLIFTSYTPSLFAANPPPQNETVIEEKMSTEWQSFHQPGVVSLYHPNYVLPLYHTSSPYEQIYEGNTPNNQKVMQNEFKAQISFLLPLYRNELDHKPFIISAAYTQLMYWQFYAKSQYFRETNYQPEVFIQAIIHPSLSLQLGINHQSNGRGGTLERSWNRVIGQAAWSGDDWFLRLRGWALVAQSVSSDLDNPDIAHYLGYDNLLFAYHWREFTWSAQVQNIESGLKRGFFMTTLSYPVLGNISLYGQFFNGYGQSLIEYDHRTASYGIGIAINDEINN